MPASETLLWLLTLVDPNNTCDIEFVQAAHDDFAALKKEYKAMETQNSDLESEMVKMKLAEVQALNAANQKQLALEFPGEVGSIDVQPSLLILSGVQRNYSDFAVNEHNSKVL